MEIKTPLSGLICPIPVPFEADGGVAETALASYCRYLVDAGVTAVLVTVGTSRFNLLTRDEMLRVNQIVAEAASGSQTVSIVSGPGPASGSTTENLAFAKAAADNGADALIAVFPERWYGNEHVQDFFLRLADEAPLPIFIHAVPVRDGFGGIHSSKPTGLEILKPLVAHERILGIKEENGDRDEFEAILSYCKEKVTVIGAGGAMRRYQRDLPLGTTNYLVGIESMVPKIGLQFLEAIQAGQSDAAEQIAVQHEDPFFKKAVEFGWHRSLKAGLSIMDLMPGFERAPFPAVDESQRNELAAIISHCGWSA